MATIGKVLKDVGQGIFNRTLGRLTGAGINTTSNIERATARWSGRKDDRDWRVRLQIPTGATELYSALMENNKLLEPLREARGIFWPLTPIMQIQHSANYNPLSQTHSNYPFQAYQNSQVDSFNILGEFPVQNQQDAAHWVATVNFLRTVTKMFFGTGLGEGDDPLKGNPPPILHLSGYGDHMFQKVPVVINSFNVELRQGIDYISTRQDNVFYGTGFSTSTDQYREAVQRRLGGGQDINDLDQTWAPTLSNISVLVTPVYSRQSIKGFSLRDFARGKLNGKGRDEIGFI